MACVRGTLFTLIIAFIPFVARCEQIDLKFHPAKGSVMRLKTTLEQKVTQTADKKEATVGQTLSLTYRIATQEVTESAATLKVVYEAVSFKQQSPLGNAEYDSENPPAVIPPVAKGFAALVGQSLEMKIGPSGRVTDVKGIEGLIDEVIRRLDIPDGPVKPLLEQSLRRDFGADAIRENMESIFLIYPDRLVSVGDTWTHSVTVSRGFPVVIDTTYTLKEMDGEKVLVAAESKLSSKPELNPPRVGTQRLTYDLTGTQRGTITLGRKDGSIRDGDLKQKVSGNMTAETGEGKTETPLAVESHITFEGK